MTGGSETARHPGVHPSVPRSAVGLRPLPPVVRCAHCSPSGTNPPPHTHTPQRNFIPAGTQPSRFNVTHMEADQGAVLLNLSHRPGPGAKLCANESFCSYAHQLGGRKKKSLKPG